MYLNRSEFPGHCKAVVLPASPEQDTADDDDDDKEEDHGYDDYRQELLSVQCLS